MRPTAAAILALVPAAALAQPYTATYIIDIQNPILASGQSTQVRVLVSFEPGIGQIISNGTSTGAVLGLSDGGFNLSGQGSGAVAGSWSNLHLAFPYFFVGPPPGIASGLSVNAVLWGMGFLLTPNHPSPKNPDEVWGGTFTASQVSGPGTVTLTTTGVAQVGVFFGGPIPVVALYQPLPGTAQITIIPAPAAFVPAGAALAFALRRRR